MSVASTNCKEERGISDWDSDFYYTGLAHTRDGCTTDRVYYCDDVEWEWYQRYATGVSLSLYLVGDILWALLPVIMGSIINFPCTLPPVKGDDKDLQLPVKNTILSSITVISTGLTVNIADFTNLGIAEMAKLRSDNCGNYDKSVGLAKCNTQPPDATTCELKDLQVKVHKAPSSISYESYAQFARKLFTAISAIDRDTGCSQLKALHTGVGQHISNQINISNCPNMKNAIKGYDYHFNETHFLFNNTRYEYSEKTLIMPIKNGAMHNNITSLMGMLICGIAEDFTTCT